MFTIRQLTIKDLDQVIDLHKRRPTVFDGYTDDLVKSYIDQHLDTIFRSPLYYVIGMFLDDQLYGCFTAKESENTPSWTWGHWVSRLSYDKRAWSPAAYKTFREGEKMLFDEMEINRKLNRFFIFYQLDEDKNDLDMKSVVTGSARRLQQGSKINVRLAKYKWFTDCIIEPNTVPKYAYQKSISMNRTWPIRTIIRMGVLSE